MAKQKTVKISKDGAEGDVLAESAKVWERNGWTVVDDGDSNDAQNVEPQPEVQQPAVERPVKQQPADKTKE